MPATAQPAAAPVAAPAAPAVPAPAAKPAAPKAGYTAFDPPHFVSASKYPRQHMGMFVAPENVWVRTMEPSFLSVNTEVDLVEVVVTGRALNAVIHKLVGAVNELEAQIRELRENAAEGKTERQMLHAELEDVKTQLSERDDSLVEALKKEVEETREQAQSERRKVESLEYKMADLVDRLKVQEERAIPDIGPMERDISSLKQADATLEGGINDLHVKASRCKEAVDTVTAKLSTATSDSNATSTLVSSLMTVFSFTERSLTTAIRGKPSDGLSSSAQYLLSTPALAHIMSHLTALQASFTIECGRVTTLEADTSDKILKTNQRLVTKLDKDAFTAFKTDSTKWREQLEGLQEAVSVVEADLLLRATEEALHNEVARLEVNKANKGDILNLPSKQEMKVFKRNLDGLDERLIELKSETDVQVRSLRTRKASISSISTGMDPRDVEKLRKAVEVLKKADTLLDENKVDRMEWKNIQDYVEQMAEQLAQLGHVVGAGKLIARDNHECNNAAAADVRMEKETAEHGLWKKPVLKTTIKKSSLAALEEESMLRDGLSGPWEDDSIRRPQSAGPASFAKARNLPLRPASAGPTNSYQTDHQASVSIPLQHIPAGIRMGRPSRLTSLDGSVTNATVTPRYDLDHHHHALSPTSQPRLTSRADDTLD